MAVTESQTGESAPTPVAEPSGVASSSGAKSRLAAVGLWIAIGLFLVLTQRIFVYIPDDTYITFRYSRNLAEGFGPVFNRNAPPSDRTEGYSCPLYMFLVALLMKLPLGIDILFRAKWLCLALGIGTLVVAQRLARRLGLPEWAWAVIPVLLAAHSSIVVSSVNGMETILMAFLVTLATHLFVGEWQAAESGGKTSLGSAWVFAACALTRPEGILFGLAAAGLLLVGKRGKWSGREARWLLAYLVPVVAFLLWRKWYYDAWLPNTYYAKRRLLEEALEKGGAYLLRTFFKGIGSNMIYAALGAGWWALVIAGGASNRFLRAPGVIVSLLAVCQVVFVLKSGGDGMGGWRFMASVVPLLMLLSVAGIGEIANALAKMTQSAKPGLTAAGALCVALLGISLMGYKDYADTSFEGYRSWSSTGFTLDPRRMMQGWLLEMTFPISDWLNAHTPPGSVVAYTEMGLTPYLSPNTRFLDANGLTDRGVATLPGAAHAGNGVVDEYTTLKGVIGSYLRDERKPDYIIQGAQLRAGELVVPISILDGAYKFEAAIPLPERKPGSASYMYVWKRKKG